MSLRRVVPMVMALALLWPLCHQVIFQRRFSRNVIPSIHWATRPSYGSMRGP